MDQGGPGMARDCPGRAGNGRGMGQDCPGRARNGPGVDSHVAVDLLGLTVAPQQPPQDPHAPHPGDLLRHAGVGRALPLAWRGERGEDEPQLLPANSTLTPKPFTLLFSSNNQP